MQADTLIPAKSAAYRATTMASYHLAVRRAIQAMHEQLDEPLTLRDMARIAFVSPFHFNRIFHQITGIPPCQFLYALRLETAKRMLLTTRLSVIEVCYAVGYNSLGTFTRRFTDLVGVSPTRLRSIAQSSKNGIPVWADCSPHLLEEPGGLGIRGYVHAPKEFQGMIFVGLFNSPIPQGSPLACAILTGSGAYQMKPVKAGEYYLFAAGLCLPEDSKELFCYESALRGGGQTISVDNGAVSGLTDIFLRPPELFDPPILVTFPPLLGKKA